MSAAAIHEYLIDLAARIARIKPPDHRRPDQFHEQRSEVARRARHIAEWVRTGRRPAELTDIVHGCNSLSHG